MSQEAVEVMLERTQRQRTNRVYFARITDAFAMALCPAPSAFPRLRMLGRRRRLLPALRRRGIARDAALLGEPRAEVDQLAALAAEGPVGRGLGPLDESPAGGTLDARFRHGLYVQQLNMNCTSLST